MRWRWIRWAALSLALPWGLPLALGASPRLVIDRISGDAHGVIRQQLVRALCGPLPCIHLSSVSRAGRLDWRAIRRQSGTVVGGRVTRARRSESVLLRVRDGPRHVLGHFAFPLARHRLSAGNLDALRGDLAGLLGIAPRTPPPTPLKPSPIPFPNPQSQPSAPPPAGLPPGQSAAARPPATSTLALPNLRWMAASVGVGLLDISLSWKTLQTANLRSYRAATAFTPVFAFEAFPLAHAFTNWVRGFGISARYAFVVGLKSSIPSGPTLPTHFYDFDLAVKLRLQPFSKSPFLFEPLVGFRLSRFSVNKVDGSVVTGLPPLVYQGPKVGFAALYPVWRFRLLGRAVFFPRLAAGEILSAAFFPQGSLWGFDLALGADYPLLSLGQTGRLSLRLWLSFTDYQYSFTVAPTDVYRASGATSTYLAGRLMARYAF